MDLAEQRSALLCDTILTGTRLPAVSNYSSTILDWLGRLKGLAGFKISATLRDLEVKKTWIRKSEREISHWLQFIPIKTD